MEITSKSVRAALLLPQDFSHYVNWQKLHVPGSEFGQIRDALEYYRFMKYRDTLLGANRPQYPPVSGTHTATECGHTIHPGDKIITELCPVCEVTAHLTFMHAITVAWNKAGGPRLLPGVHRPKKSYAQLHDDWHTARLQLQKLLERFAIAAVYEEDWNAKNPLQAAAARRTRCASAAIELAQMDSKYPARLSPPSLEVVKAKPARRVRKVTFADEIQVKDKEGTFPAATIFAHYRRRHSYYRRSSAYRPGIHACPPGSEYIDTSQMNLLSANVSNLKIYITDDEEAFDYTGDCQGIVGLHKLENEISQFIHDFMEQDEESQEELEDLVEDADRLIVLVDEHDNLLDVNLINVNDKEDEADNGADGKGKGTESEIWTCLRDCLL